MLGLLKLHQIISKPSLILTMPFDSQSKPTQFVVPHPTGKDAGLSPIRQICQGRVPQVQTATVL